MMVKNIKKKLKLSPTIFLSKSQERNVCVELQKGRKQYNEVRFTSAFAIRQHN